MFVDLVEAPDVVVAVLRGDGSTSALRHTLDSVAAQQSDARIGVIVVSQSHDSPALEPADRVTIFRPGMNLSRGGIMNAIRSQISSEFVWVVAEGSVFGPQVLAGLLHTLREQSSLAVARPVPRNETGRIPRHQLGGYVDSEFGEIVCLPESITPTITRELDQQLEFVHLSGSLVRLRAWDDVSGMDDRFLSDLWSDADFCLRLLRAGFTVTHAHGTDFYPAENAPERVHDRFLARFDEALARSHGQEFKEVPRAVSPHVSRATLENFAGSTSQALDGLGDLLNSIVDISDELSRTDDRIPVWVAGGFTAQYPNHQSGVLVAIARALNRWFRRLRFSVDSTFYRRAYADLRSLTAEQALAHWKTSGSREGRFPSRRAVDAQARVHGLSLRGIDIAEYMLANPHLGDYGITTYEAAYVIMAGDVRWLRNPTFVSLPDEFLASLEHHRVTQGDDGWTYARAASDLERGSELARALDGVPADVFVRNVFRFFVGHAPTVDGFHLWVARLDSGEYARVAVIAALASAGPFDLFQLTSSTTLEEITQASLDLELHRYNTRQPSEIVELMGIPISRVADWYRQAFDALADPSLATNPVKISSRERQSPKPRSKPRASVLVSLYQSDAHLEAWLRNVTALDDFASFEFIIVSVAPSEFERSLLDAFESQHSNVVLVYRDAPFGIYAAWNLAINLASADYVTNMNVDDVRAPRSLVVQSNLLDRYEWVDVVYQDVRVSLDSNLSWRQLEQIDSACQIPIASTPRFLTGMNPPHNGPMWRRKLHDELGPFDETFRSAADFDFWFRCSAAGKVFFHVPDAHVGYFHNPDGMSTSSEGVGLREGRVILAKNQSQLVTGDAPSYLSRHREFDPLLTRQDRLTTGFIQHIIQERLK